MRAVRLVSTILFALPLLSACVEEGSGGYYRPTTGYAPPPSHQTYNSSPSVRSSSLSDGQRAALAQGCQARYRGHSNAREKIYECEHGNGRVSREAMTQGCHIRYDGNRHKLRECLEAAWD